MSILFIEDEEELQCLEENNNFEDIGMSGTYAGWHCLIDSSSNLTVYYKLSQQ